MKYRYIYKTSDGVKHEGKISAPGRDQCFELLHAQGVRPIKVIACDGTKANGADYGVRKRVVGCLVLGALCLGAVVAFTVGSRVPRDRDVGVASAEFLTSKERRQIIGDAAIIERGIKDGWETVFPYEGERFLASFAVPGVPAGLRNTTEDEIRDALKRSEEEAVGKLRIDNGELRIEKRELSLEGKQIAAIVEGMKDELRAFIADGKHTIVEYGQRLVQRQEQEIAYYQRAKTEIEVAAKTMDEVRHAMQLDYFA